MLFWANVPGSFTRGNLDGKLFIVEFFIEFRFTNTSLAVSQGEAHRMVMDFQTKAQPSKTKWPKVTSLFSAHHGLCKFSPLIYRTAKRTFPWQWRRSPSRGQQRLWRWRWWLWKQRGRGRYHSRWEEHRSFQSSPNHLKSSPRSTKECIDIKCAESDSDLGDDENRILIYDDHNIPSDDEAMDDDESTQKWKLNLSERAQHSSSREARRKVNYVILVHFLLEEKFSMAKGKMRTGTSRWTLTTIKNMEASLDSGKTTSI